MENLDKVTRLVQITQKPIGRTPRSTLATYTGLFDHVRKLLPTRKKPSSEMDGLALFLQRQTGAMPNLRRRGPNRGGARLSPGSYTLCPDCQGKRYNPETLEVSWEGRTIAEVLELTVDEAAELFAEVETSSAVTAIRRALDTLQAVGLGYLRLGQGAPELSGGEAQRIKLATELQRSRNSHRGHTVYLLDEPTTGLHPADVSLLNAELHKLVDAGQTVIVVEHDLSVIAQADTVIELGPGQAPRAENVAMDAPGDVAKQATPTGRALARKS